MYFQEERLTPFRWRLCSDLKSRHLSNLWLALALLTECFARSLRSWLGVRKAAPACTWES